MNGRRVMRNVYIVVCILEITFSRLQGKKIPNFAGPYQIVIRRITNESDEFNSTGEMWPRIYVSHHKPGQLQYRWGLECNTVDITDDLSVDIRVAQWSNNQWKKNAFVIKLHRGCSDAFKISPSISKFLIGRSRMTCPIKPGLRQLANETVDITFAPLIPVLPYGRYRFTGCMQRGSECMGIFSMEGDVDPRL